MYVLLCKSRNEPFAKVRTAQAKWSVRYFSSAITGVAVWSLDAELQLLAIFPMGGGLGDVIWFGKCLYLSNEQQIRVNHLDTAHKQAEFDQPRVAECPRQVAECCWPGSPPPRCRLWVLGVPAEAGTPPPRVGVILALKFSQPPTPGECDLLWQALHAQGGPPRQGCFKKPEPPKY